MDVQEDKAKKLAKEFKCQYFTDPAQLIGKVDAVTISAPTKSHLALAEIFIKNKIAILIEKPLAVSSGEGEKIVKLNLKTGDRVIFGKYAGEEVKVDKVEYKILSDEDVLAVIE